MPEPTPKMLHGMTYAGRREQALLEHKHTWSCTDLSCPGNGFDTLEQAKARAERRRHPGIGTDVSRDSTAT